MSIARLWDVRHDAGVVRGNGLQARAGGVSRVPGCSGVPVQRNDGVVRVPEAALRNRSDSPTPASHADAPTLRAADAEPHVVPSSRTPTAMMITADTLKTGAPLAAAAVLTGVAAFVGVPAQFLWILWCFSVTLMLLMAAVAKRSSRPPRYDLSKMVRNVGWILTTGLSYMLGVKALPLVLR